MSQITPELKAAIYTYAAHRLILKRREEESARDMNGGKSSSSPAGSSRIYTETPRNLIPLSTNYYSNVLVAYSEQRSQSNTAGEVPLDPIAEEMEEASIEMPINEEDESQERAAFLRSFRELIHETVIEGEIKKAGREAKK